MEIAGPVGFFIIRFVNFYPYMNIKHLLNFKFSFDGNFNHYLQLKHELIIVRLQNS